VRAETERLRASVAEIEAELAADLEAAEDDDEEAEAEVAEYRAALEDELRETRAQLRQVAERHEQLLENQGRGVAYETYQAFGAPPRAHTLEGYEPLDLRLDLGLGGSRSTRGSISARSPSVSARSEHSEPSEHCSELGRSSSRSPGPSPGRSPSPSTSPSPSPLTLTPIPAPQPQP